MGAQCTLLLALFISLGSSLNARQTENVSLLSRIDFAPALLEMVSNELMHATGRQFSLIVRPVESQNASSASELNKYMLVEDGIDKSFLPPDTELTDVSIRLIWALAVQKTIPPLAISRETTLEAFGRLLIDLRTRYPDKFPWFEGLLSRNTMRNFCLVLGEKKSERYPKNISGQPFWEQPHATAVLYKAIEAELLNPLSVESDLSLAMEVFEAGDAMFVSHWVPESCFSGNSDAWPLLKSGFLVPFPRSDNSGRLPAITLHLWKAVGSPPVENIASASSNDNEVPSIIKLNYASETAWIEKNFAQNYDALIVGDL